MGLIQKVCMLGFVTFCYTNAYNQVGDMPIIRITTTTDIQDEPKVHAVLSYTDDNGEIVSDIGIEYRGGFTQEFPKKNYDIEFWTNPFGENSMDVQLAGLRKDDDWILDALYNEPLRFNSFLSHKLWLKMNRVYYADKEPNAKSGADVRFTEVYLNGAYQGIYLLSEQIDRSLLKLKKNNSNTIRGELYKAYTWDDAVLYNDPDEIPNNSSLTWSGFEFKYPSDTINWDNVYAFVDFVANSSEEDFIAQMPDKFDIENAADYFIFLNLTRGLDNRGKNIYLCRYDEEEPYFFAPWDLDGSWGLLWNGANDTQTKDILTNRLFDRLIENDVAGFRQQLFTKWHTWRQDLLSDSELEENIEIAHNYLKSKSIYEREEEVWDYEYDPADLDYLHNWLDKRLEYLDNYFAQITAAEDIYSVQISIFPNPSTGQFTISGLKQFENQIKVYDLMGSLISTDIILGSQGQISLEDKPKGSYILVLGSERILIQKF